MQRFVDSTGRDGDGNNVRDLNQVQDEAYDAMQQLGIDGWELVSHQVIPTSDEEVTELVDLMKRMIED